MSAAPATDFLACPRCGGKLGGATSANSLECGACRQRYPLVGDIPWLFEFPEAELIEWQARARAAILTEAAHAAALSAKLKQKATLPAGKKRVEAMRDGHEKLGAQIGKLLQGFLAIETPKTQTAGGQLVRAPYVQGITAYITNLFRDWAWGDTENQLSLDCVLRALPSGAKPKRVLVLGAGAARLAFDLHAALAPERTTALDANPLLLLAGAKVSAGEELRFQEFPLAPRDQGAHTVSRILRAPAPAQPGLGFVLGDVYRAPFAPESFDLVVTPWLVDILPEDARAFLQRLNPLVAKGGHWLYFGSMAFAQKDQALNYSLEEIEEAAAEAGFAVKAKHQAEIPYLDSPASCMTRTELVTAFCAEKTEAREAPGAPLLLAPYLADPAAPIPRVPEFENVAQVSSVLLEIVALIDGKTSVRQIAGELGKRYGMDPPTTETLVQRFLNDVIQRQSGK